MNKELEALEKINHTICLNNLEHNIKWALDKYDNCDCRDFTEFAKCYDTIETALKQAEENEKLLNVFRNALTIERDIPPELEIKESEKGCSYVFKEAVKIHENRIEEMYKKSLREWVFKNAFPKELAVLEIIKRKKVDVSILVRLIAISLEPLKEYNDTIWGDEKENRLTEEEFEILKEALCIK